MLLAGGDLIASFGHPGVWSTEDVNSAIINKRTILIECLVTSYCRALWLCDY